MATVGRTLGTERIRQGLDLDNVAALTKIPPRALRAIEADEFEQLPGAMFARNFVRQYAEALRLDGAAAVEQFNREQRIAEPDISRLAQQPKFHVPGMARPIWSQALDGSAASAFFTFVVTLAVCAGAFYLFQYVRANHAARTAAEQRAIAARPDSKKAEQRATQVEPVGPVPVPMSVPASTEEAAGETNGADGMGAAPPAQRAPDEAVAATGSVHVAVEASEACWARVTVDGKTLFTGTLAPGEPKQFDGTETVQIRAGNAGALAIKLNGNEVPTIGPKGQIRIVELTAAGAQVRTPTPDPVLDF